jgi:uncharacterized protein (DUF433 family)
MSKFFARITIHPEQCGGQPCIRGVRIRVIDVLGFWPVAYQWKMS